ncbi:MAG: flavodoxin family protein [Euryarchaeota archaeon]|nr:flavodoxin family protein [Euryarchaeota archaeon]
MTKVIAINGSARKDGNTAFLIRRMLEELENEGIETELIQLAGRTVRGCAACGQCFENRDGRCAYDDDIVNGCIAKMTEADGIILGSPVYFFDVTAEMKALIDRAGYVSLANDGLFTRKVGSAVVVQRRAGAIHALDTLLHFLLIGGMIVPGLPPIGVGRDFGDIKKDEEGIARATNVSVTMAWLLKARTTR